MGGADNVMQYNTIRVCAVCSMRARRTFRSQQPCGATLITVPQHLQAPACARIIGGPGLHGIDVAYHHMMVHIIMMIHTIYHTPRFSQERGARKLMRISKSLVRQH